jgi:hypothetical protein
LTVLLLLLLVVLLLLHKPQPLNHLQVLRKGDVLIKFDGVAISSLPVCCCFAFSS